MILEIGLALYFIIVVIAVISSRKKTIIDESEMGDV
jgi:hypothetical protein